MLRFRITAALSLGLALLGCQSTSGPLPSGIEADDFALVLLRTGPNQEARTEELFGEHFAFMQGLAAEGTLLIAGPFGPEKNPTDLSGIFILDEDDMESARAIAGMDPPTLAGVFRQDVMKITTLNVIRKLPQMETARKKEREAAGTDLAERDIRAYCVVIASDGPAAARSVFDHPAISGQVVFMGRLHEPREDALFAILDVPTADEVKSRMKVAGGDEAAFEISEWYASPTIAELARVGPTDD